MIAGFNELAPGIWCIVDIDAREIIVRGTARQIYEHIRAHPRYHGTGARSFIICKDVTDP